MPLRRRLTDLLKVLGVFAVLGPPLGAMTFFAGLSLYGASESGDYAGMTWVFLFGLIYAVPLSYLMGIMPAAAAGLILGAIAVFYRVPGTLLAIAVGLLVGFGMVFSGGRPTLPYAAESASDYASALLLISTCVVPTVLCWPLARRMITGASVPDR